MASCWSFSHKHRIVLSYLYDLLLIGILFLPYLYLEKISPYERIVWRDDRTLMYPFTKHELIPGWVLPFIAFLLPMIIISTWIGIRRLNNKRLLVAYVGLAMTLMITVQLTTIIKPLVGRPRPDFLARCDPDPTILAPVVCRGDSKLIHEGRRSFPSGHTSSCFAGLSFATFFLSGQLNLFSGEGRAYRMIICMIPFMIASFVGISRIMDYRHHWQDVLAGAILGIVVSYLCYRMYFPPIISQQCDQPLDIRFVRLADKDNDDYSSSNQLNCV